MVKKDLQEYEKLSKQIDVTQAKLSRLGVKAQEAGDIMKRISQSSVRKLNRTLKTLQKSLQGVPRGSEEWNVLTQAIRKTREEISKVEMEQKAASEAGITQMSSWGNKWVGFVTVLDKVRSAVSEAISSVMGFYEQYAAMAEHMSSVKKYTGLDEQAEQEHLPEYTGSREYEAYKTERYENRKEDSRPFARAVDGFNVARLPCLFSNATNLATSVTARRSFRSAVRCSARCRAA